MFKLSLSTICSLVLGIASSAVVSAGSKVSISISRTVLIDDVPYYLPAEPAATLPGVQLGSAEVVPFALFTTSDSALNATKLSAQISQWSSTDDVFADEFLGAALVSFTGRGSGSIPPSAVSLLAKEGVKTLFTSGIGSFNSQGIDVQRLSSASLPAGPYVLARGGSGVPSIFVPYRLFFDDTQSFFKSVTPTADGTFAVVSASLDTDSSPYVGVPSKAYALSVNKTTSPLAGIRVSVKDIYRLKGLRTSAGNRAFYALYPPNNSTAPAVTRLMDLGANIIGITKTVQFANGDRATVDWVDYHAPFVVRGDGYREPSGSSTGAAAGLSAFDFIDVAIGSDTGGSIRGPSGVNGLYGIRPSVGAITLDNVVPLSDVLDTGGYITRDPHLFTAFGKAWYADSFTPFPAFPKKILLSSSFASVNRNASEIYQSFFKKLQGFLGTDATVANFSIAAEWNMTSGTGIPVAQWLNTTYPTLIAFHQWTVVGQQLFTDYAAANQGRNPHINPAVLLRWQYGQAQGIDGYNVALNQRSTFENWTSNNFLLENTQSCSDSLYLYPQNAGNSGSREVYSAAPSSPPFGFSDSRVAVHARSPDMVLPVGQIPFFSTITGITEQLPVTVSIVARRGCDFMLLDLVSKLADAGILQTVKTGRTAF